jgi:hypothetical protein
LGAGVALTVLRTPIPAIRPPMAPADHFASCRADQKTVGRIILQADAYAGVGDLYDAKYRLQGQVEP